MITRPAYKNNTDTKAHEARLVPQEGDDIFIYFGKVDASNKLTSKEDISNVNKIMKKFGYSKNL